MSIPKHLLTQAILANKLSGSELEALLTDGYLGTWKNLLKSRDLSIMLKNPTSLATLFASATAFGALLDLEGAELAASDAATETISNTSAGILLVVSNTAYLNLWQNVPANKTRLLARVNASGSKLRGATFTSNGTWTAPVTPIVGLSVFALGGGGNGGSGFWSGGSARAGSGGSGGEASTKSASSGLPTTNQTVTIGSAGGASSFGAFLSAAGGVDGTDGGGPTSGGGSNVGTIFDTNPTAAIWQPNTANKQGGAGGSGLVVGFNANGYNGSAGLSGSGGSGGTQNGSSCTSANAGSGLGSGGGGGAAIYPAGAASAGGNPASVNSGCGGGGGSGTSGPGSAGMGGSGLVVVHWIDG